ncbi:hypothetical protein RI129_006529 [Pyrocoelia pectoralis]|uniref:Uncharacterized protein n=1 Tax=Pyrocoelia pectoralis TaxID=417401 RepID=A0AAN7VK81_9COLE
MLTTSLDIPPSSSGPPVYQEVFSSDDSVADPNFTDSTLSDSDTELSGDANKNITKRKILFPSKLENKTRKRLRREKKWPRNHNKILKNSGKAYESFKKITNEDGTVVTRELVTRMARKLLPPCGEKCRLACTKKINEDDRLIIFNEFWALSDLQRQRDFIANCMTPIKTKYGKENDRRRLNNAFHLIHNGDKSRVCRKFFVATLGISTRMLRTVDNKIDPNTRIVSKDSRGKHGNHSKLPDTVKDGIRRHINSIPRIESHYCRARTSKEYIDGGKSISDLYRDYVKICQEKNEKHGHYTMYYSIYNTEFNIVVSTIGLPIF